jgi:hypothetical protein
VNYATPDKHDPGFATIEFDTTGGTNKIFQSLETRNSYGVKGFPTDYNGAINVSGKPGNAKPDGVEIHQPALKFTVAGVLPFDECGVDYVKLMASAAGCTNDAPFMGFDTGELLFLGSSGQTRKTSEDQPGVDVKWQFAASANADDLSIAGVDGIEKAGWDYLWCHYVPQEDPDANVLVSQCDGIYVERVYEEFDFSQLNIPDLSDQESSQGYPT